METIQEKLREAKSVMKESERDTKFKEAIESMKRLFPGVRGRIVDLCAPVQSKYKLAVTVALGPSMEAIVVDKEKTARECIAVSFFIFSNPNNFNIIPLHLVFKRSKNWHCHFYSFKS